MDLENNQEKKDAEEYAELIQEAKKNSRLYSYLSVAVQSYMDGLKAACRCQQHAQLFNQKFKRKEITNGNHIADFQK